MLWLGSLEAIIDSMIFFDLYSFNHTLCVM
jgi:hypothetical protein